MMLTKPFVLSGGGARGFAHLGVIKALNEFGLSPSEISGTSAGAVAGAFLADGFTPDEVVELFSSKMNVGFLGLNSMKLGLISIKKIRDFIESNLRHQTFERLSMPLYVTATNFVNGKQTIFSSGKLIDPILASCSIPVLFSPVMIQAIPYVDGGLSNNLPIEPFVNRKNEIVSIYVNPLREFKSDESIMEVLDRSVHLSFREIVNQSSQNCFMYIEPENLNQFGLFDVQKLIEIVDVGYSFTKHFLQNHPSLVLK